MIVLVILWSYQTNDLNNRQIQWEITEEDDDPGVPLLQSESANRAIMLIVGYLPGIKVEAIPLLKQIEARILRSMC